jgi:GTP-binding protein
MLVHIVDVSGSEGRDPVQDFETINDELRKFNPALAERPMVVAGNKCDMATDEQIEAFKQYVNAQGYDFFPIMAAIRYDVDPLLKKIQGMLSKLPPIAHFEPEPAPVVSVEDFDDHSVTIKNIDGVYVVEADWLLQVMRGINFDDYESLNYFQRVLENGGVIDALREKGVEDGDTVSIYDIEFDFME